VRLSLLIAEHPWPSEVPRRLQSLGELLRQRHVPHSATFRCRDVTFPFGACDRQLPVVEIDVALFERHDFAAPQTCFTAQQHDQLCCGAVILRSLEEFLEVGEVVERRD